MVGAWKERVDFQRCVHADLCEIKSRDVSMQTCVEIKSRDVSILTCLEIKSRDVTICSPACYLFRVKCVDNDIITGLNNKVLTLSIPTDVSCLHP